MPVYFVSLSLRSSGYDYSRLREALQMAEAQPAVDASWFIDVNWTLRDLTNRLLSMVDKDDRLIIIEMVRDTVWSAINMDDQTKAWLRRRMRSTSTRLEQPVRDLKRLM